MFHPGPLSLTGYVFCVVALFAAFTLFCAFYVGHRMIRRRDQIADLVLSEGASDILRFQRRSEYHRRLAYEAVPVIFAVLVTILVLVSIMSIVMCLYYAGVL